MQPINPIREDDSFLQNDDSPQTPAAVTACAPLDQSNLFEGIFGDPYRLPPEVEEAILIEGADFESLSVSRLWYQAASADLIWIRVGKKLGLSDICAPKGGMFLKVREFCTTYMRMIDSLFQATPDLKKLLRGQLSLAKMLQIMEWKVSRDRIVILQELAGNPGFSRPRLLRGTMKDMLKAGKMWASWVFDNRAALSRVKSVCLKYERIHQIPTAVWQMHRLLHLDLYGNDLGVIPEQITRLTNLTVLCLDSNAIKVLPDAIWQLTRLSDLSLNWNRLTELPAGVGKLHSLTRLSLSHNELSGLPSEIVQLTRLISLSLEYNCFTKCPNEIRQLRCLRYRPFDYNFLSLCSKTYPY